MLLVLLFALFYSLNSIAQDGIGIYRLNPLPEKEWVSRSFFMIEDADVTVNISQTDTKEIQEKHYVVQQEIGFQFQPQSYFSVSLDYGKSDLSELRNGQISTDTYSVVGFMEPRFKIYSRRKIAKGIGEPILDVTLEYAPSFAKSETGSSGGNRFSGRDNFTITAEYGKFYDYWDFKISGIINYYSDGKSKNLETKETSDLKSYTETEAAFSVQHTLSDMYFVRAGIGLRIISDQDIVNDDNTATVQNGTGSHHYLGLVRHKDSYTTILKVERIRNDYFVQSEGQSYEGDYVFRSISLEVLWEI